VLKNNDKRAQFYYTFKIKTISTVAIQVDCSSLYNKNQKTSTFYIQFLWYLKKGRPNRRNLLFRIKAMHCQTLLLQVVERGYKITNFALYHM